MSQLGDRGGLADTVDAQYEDQVYRVIDGFQGFPSKLLSQLRPEETKKAVPVFRISAPDLRFGGIDYTGSRGRTDVALYEDIFQLVVKILPRRPEQVSKLCTQGFPAHLPPTTDHAFLSAARRYRITRIARFTNSAELRANVPA